MMEHRHGKRLFVRVSVKLKYTVSRTTQGIMRNISRGGMYVETLATPPTDSCLEVGMAMRTAAEPTLVWVPRFVVRSSATGIGLMMYKDIDGAADAALDRVLRCGRSAGPGGARGL